MSWICLLMLFSVSGDEDISLLLMFNVYNNCVFLYLHPGWLSFPLFCNICSISSMKYNLSCMFPNERNLALTLPTMQRDCQPLGQAMQYHHARSGYRSLELPASISDEGHRSLAHSLLPNPQTCKMFRLAVFGPDQHCLRWQFVSLCAALLGAPKGCLQLFFFFPHLHSSAARPVNRLWCVKILGGPV